MNKTSKFNLGSGLTQFILITIIFTTLGAVQHWGKFSLDIQGKHTWRQCATMWNVRNFARHDNNILNPRLSHFNGGKDNIVRLEFPLLQWSISQPFKYFKEDIRVVRLSLFFLGIFATIGMFYLFRYIFDDSLIALLSALCFYNSPLFFYYTMNPLPDNLSLAFVIWYLVFFLKYYRDNKYSYLIWSSFFLCIASLSKLPFIIFAGVSLFHWIGQFYNKHYKAIVPEFLIQFLFLIPVISWYAWVIPSWGDSPVMGGIFRNEIPFSEVIYIVKYHLKDMFPFQVMSPISTILFFYGAYLYIKSGMKWFWLNACVLFTMLYFVLEFNAIHVIHDYYMLPFLVFIYVMVGIAIKEIYRMQKLAAYALVALQIIYTPIRTEELWKQDKGINPDLYTYRQELIDVVPKGEQCIILNDISQAVYSYYLDKQGCIFYGDNLPALWVEDMIKNYDMKYMYSDSEKINKDPEIAKMIRRKILDAGTMKVYELHIENK